MKVLALILGLVVCLSAVSAREGYTPLAAEELPNLEDVLTIGSRASLKLALEEGKIAPGIFHVDKLLSLARQIREDATSYEVIVEVSDNLNPNAFGVVEYILEQSNESKNSEYVLKAHFVTMANKKNVNSDF